jgi:GR25 family glycosyltransferase involved in LPS biosynthesis
MIGIVAHTARAEQAQQLMETVGAAYTSIDNGTLGCERNHHRTWQWLSQHNHGDWCVVLEDDAVPVPGFTSQLPAALDAAPSPIVSLYLGQKRPPHWMNAVRKATETATSHNACWITGKQLLHAVAVAVRAELLDDMLTAAANSRRPWDYRIGEFAQRTKETIAYSWPSLVNHADTESVTRHQDGQPRTPGRVAWKTGTRTHWTPASVPIQP